MHRLIRNVQSHCLQRNVCKLTMSSRWSLMAYSSGPPVMGLEGLHQPSDFARLVEEAIPQCNAWIKTAVEVSPSRQTLHEVDKVSNAVCKIVDTAEVLSLTHGDAEWRDAAVEASGNMSHYMETCNSDVPLYRAMKSITEDADLMENGLTDEERRVVSLHVRDLELHGIALSDAERQQSVLMQQQCNYYETMFGSPLDANTHYVELIDVAEKHRAIVAGLCVSCATSAQDRQMATERLRVPLTSFALNKFMAKCPDANARQQVYRAFYASPVISQRLVVLNRLLAVRSQLAVFRGHTSYTEFALQKSILNTSQQVQAFLSSLMRNLQPRVSQELGWLRDIKKDREANVDFTEWDRIYYMQILKGRQLEQLRMDTTEYLSLDNCLEGLKLLSSEVFQCTLLEVPCEENWGSGVDQVRQFEFWDDAAGRQLGVLYLDVLDRPTKGGRLVASCSLQAGCGINDLAKCVLSMSIPPPAPGRRISLTIHNAEALFHEFGHCLHMLFSNTEMQHLAGARGELDYVEIPSMLMEKFFWDYRVMKKWAKNNSGDILPEEYFNALKKAENLFWGLDLQQQVLLSLIDQRLHTMTITNESLDDPDLTGPVVEQVWQEFGPYSYPSGSHHHATFAHLGGYGAGYYTYLYGRVVSSAIWSKMFAADPFCTDAGKVYRRELLEKGGGKDPEKILENLLDDASLNHDRLTQYLIATESSEN